MGHDAFGFCGVARLTTLAVRISYSVTTTLSAKGQIVIPQEIRVKLNLQPGDDFAVLSSGTGEILLRPIRRRRRKSLVEALQALHGLKLVRSDEPIRDVPL
jgi:AbrB family looped-hinge helix DNA binding protein